MSYRKLVGAYGHRYTFGQWQQTQSSNQNSKRERKTHVNQARETRVSQFRVVFNWLSKVIAELLWFCFTTLSDWFNYSTNQIQNYNQSRLGRTRFPALAVGYV